MLLPSILLQNEEELLERSKDIEGLNLAQLASTLNLHIPNNPLQRKGWVGQAIELALGTTAGNRPGPDFLDLGIELKTLPINHLGKPAESTFVTSIALLSVHQECWNTSPCWTKLKRVLWFPIEAEKNILFPHRRIGRAILWSPTPEDAVILEQDWLELTFMIGTGKLTEIHAGIGQYLQVRPKAANSKSLCYGFDETGRKVQTLPRGFYLRSSYTATIFA